MTRVTIRIDFDNGQNLGHGHTEGGSHLPPGTGRAGPV